MIAFRRSSSVSYSNSNVLVRLCECEVAEDNEPRRGEEKWSGGQKFGGGQIGGRHALGLRLPFRKRDQATSQSEKRGIWRLRVRSSGIEGSEFNGRLVLALLEACFECRWNSESDRGSRSLNNSYTEPLRATLSRQTSEPEAVALN